MKLKKFIQKLKKLSKKYGNDAQVIMADDVSVVSPVFSEKYSDEKSIVITDKN